jgi:chromosome segregation ATPase
MARKPYPPNTIKQAQTVLDKWKQINPSMTLGDLTQAGLEANMNKELSIQSRMTALKAELTDLQNQRDATCTDIWDQVKRVRSGVKAIYGDDSSQYEMIGGTRRSERKRPVRKTAASAPPAPAKTE